MMVKIIINEEMENPIIASFEKAYDGTFNIHVEEMVQNQWYQFDNAKNERFYMKIDNQLVLLLTREKPEK